ncbi:hypothetical protein [uncultured Dubosiella sp.]|nr:hypothetical protein [uncultured Dubosiella sp.]
MPASVPRSICRYTRAGPTIHSIPHNKRKYCKIGVIDDSLEIIM